MKKHIVSFGLALLMLISALSVLTGCQENRNTQEDSVVKPLTLTLTMVTGRETTPEGIAAAQAAMNKITENDLNIHVVLQLYTEDEYKSAVMAKLKARQADVDAGIKKTSIGQETDKKIIEIVEGQKREVTAFPDPYENQIDIFMIPDREMYLELYSIANATEGVRVDYLDRSDVDAGITSEDVAPKLVKYISGDLLGYCTDDIYGGSISFIPRTYYYGEYEYLLVKKELFDKYPYTITDMKSLPDLREYLVDVAENEKGVTPLYNIFDMGLVSVTGKQSVFAKALTTGMKENDQGLTPGAITTSSDIRKILATYVDCGRVNGDYAQHNKEVDFNANFAAAFIKGTADLPAKYEDEYYVIRTGNPVAEKSAMFDYCFALSNYSSDASRCMKLIQELYTNEALLNALLYGEENVTYIKDEESGIVTRKHSGEGNSIYIMDEYQVGNAFLAWQNSEMSEEELEISADGWRLAKRAYSDAIFSPYARFNVVMDSEEDYTDSSTVLLEDYFDQLAVLYDELWVKLREFEAFDSTQNDTATADEFITYLDKWLMAQECMKQMTGTLKRGLTQQYVVWWRSIYST